MAKNAKPGGIPGEDVSAKKWAGGYLIAGGEISLEDFPSILSYSWRKNRAKCLFLFLHVGSLSFFSLLFYADCFFFLSVEIGMGFSCAKTGPD